MAVLWPARKALFQVADLLPWLLGGTLVWLGLQGHSALTLAGLLLVVVAGVIHFAAANGFVVPRPGRVRITAQGCWETPLAFFVRHRGQGVLFYRASDPVTGALRETYCVIALPSECDQDTLKWRGFEPPEDSRLMGVVPARDLRFEHRGGDYVDAASLAAAIQRISVRAAEAPGC